MNTKYMQIAIELAHKGAGKVSPNPMVGCVIVKNNRIVSSAYHSNFGGLHAEALALKKAGKRAKGASLYVNLEPCCHTQKKTPPCVPQIIKAGIKEVIIGMKDPNPLVNGKGIKELRKNRIKCSVGILKGPACELNRYYIKWVTQKMPYVIAKWAMSVDGKTATKTGDSKWISSDVSRRYVHKLRSRVDAILVGINTVLKDGPQLTSHGQGKNPVRVIIDPELRIPVNARVTDCEADTIIFYSNSSKVDTKKITMLENKMIRVIGLRTNSRQNELNFKEIMGILGQNDIASVIIEGGGTTCASALKDKVIDEIIAFVAPKIIGGRDAVSPVEGEGAEKIAESILIENLHTEQFGKDILITGKVVH